MLPPAQMFKNRLQEYTQKKALPLPVYHTVNGRLRPSSAIHPQFKCSVTINGTKYESPPGFSRKKAAQNAAAKEAVEDLQRQGFKFKERKRPNSVLAELASMKNMPPTFTATVEINGTSYTGTPANSLKEAANKAAFEAIWATDPHYCIALSHDSEQLAGKPHASKSVSKTPVDNLTFNHQLLGGTESQSDESGPGKFNVMDASGPEKASEKTEMEDPAEQIHNQPQQDPLPVQQRHLKTETGYVYQYPRSEEIQGKQ